MAHYLHFVHFQFKRGEEMLIMQKVRRVTHRVYGKVRVVP